MSIYTKPIGRGIRWMGDYLPSTRYQIGDIVVYEGSSYIANNVTLNNLPTDENYWDLGAIGEKGDKGNKGDPGEKGEKGDKGDKGDPGVGDLISENNLSDLENKQTARDNLDVYNKSEVDLIETDINNTIDLVEAVTEANQQAIANLQSASGEYGYSSPIILTTTEQTVPFDIMSQSNNTDVFELNDVANTISIKKNAPHNLSTNISFLHNTTQSRTITIRGKKLSDDSLVYERSVTVEAGNNQTTNATSSTLLTIGKNGYPNSPFDLYFTVQCSGTGITINSYDTIISVGSTYDVDVSLSWGDITGDVKNQTDVVGLEYLQENYTENQSFIAGENLQAGDFIRKGLESLGEDVNKYYKKKPGEIYNNLFFVKNNYLNGEKIEAFKEGEYETSGLLNVSYLDQFQSTGKTGSNTISENQCYCFVINSEHNFIIKNNFKITLYGLQGLTNAIAYILDVDGNILKTSNTILINSSEILREFDFGADTELTAGKYSIVVENIGLNSLYFNRTNSRQENFYTSFYNGTASSITDLNALSEYSSGLFYELDIEYKTSIGTPLFLKEDNTFSFTFLNSNDLYLGKIVNDLILNTNIYHIEADNIIVSKSNTSGTITVNHGLGKMPNFIKVEGIMGYDADQTHQSNGYWKLGNYMTTVSDGSNGQTDGYVADFRYSSSVSGLATISNVTDTQLDLNVTLGNNPKATFYYLTLY